MIDKQIICGNCLSWTAEFGQTKDPEKNSRGICKFFPESIAKTKHDRCRQWENKDTDWKAVEDGE
ncbi:MAG: hypothetical protein V3V47_01910 [Desulfobacteria bacterium]